MAEVRYLDSHAHLTDEAYNEDLAEIIVRIHEAKLEKVLLIALNRDDLAKCLKLAESDDVFDVAFGYFPTDTENLMEDDWQFLEMVVQDERIVAIGEIGLDYYWQTEPHQHEIQRQAFLRQIKIAQKNDKPILIHSREAIQDTLDIVKQTGIHGIMHCFSGSVEMAREFVKCGFVLSLGGPVTFKNSRHAKEVAIDTDIGHLIIETDSPYMAPVPYRGKRNEPSYVVEVGKLIAELKGIDEEVFSTQIRENYRRILKR